MRQGPTLKSAVPPPVVPIGAAVVPVVPVAAAVLPAPVVPVAAVGPDGAVNGELVQGFFIPYGPRLLIGEKIF